MILETEQLDQTSEFDPCTMHSKISILTNFSVYKNCIQQHTGTLILPS